MSTRMTLALRLLVNDISTETIGDEHGFHEGVGFLTPAEEIKSTEAVVRVKKRVSCGCNKLFLDSCATQNTMFAIEFLVRLHTTMVYLRQNCNAGSNVTNKCGYFLDLLFYINKKGIANLLSVPWLKANGWKIHMETGKPVRALSPDGMLLTFKRDSGMTGGMPYIDMDNLQDHVSYVTPRDGTVLIETVRENLRGLTLEQCIKARAAMDALAMMAHLPDEQIKNLVSSNNVINIPFTSTDFTHSKVVFGPDRASIRGKSTRRRPHKVRPKLVQIPIALYKRLRDVILAADVMFVSGLPFLSLNLKTLN